MKFILKLLEGILESISGLYTSDQVDDLAEAKVDSESFNTALSAESEARISADEDLSGQIASAVSNQTALENVARWQGYANAMQSMVDEETAAQIAEEFEKATVEYLKDPTATKEWSPSNPPNSNGKPLVDFNVATIANGYLNGSVPSNIIFVPSASTLSSSHSNLDFGGRDVCLWAPSARAINSMFNKSKNIKNLSVVVGTTYPSSMVFEHCRANEIRIKGVKTGDYSLSRTFSTTTAKKIIIDMELPTRSSNFCYNAANLEEVQADFSNMLVATNMFYGTTALDQALAFPSLFSGDGMFLNSGMSAVNISAVLDSLPSDPVGKGGTGVITFTGCPGAAELTQSSPSVAAAVARGWTVEL